LRLWPLERRLPPNICDGKRFKWLTKIIEKAKFPKVMHVTLNDPERI
jgi:hypothetical protein